MCGEKVRNRNVIMVWIISTLLVQSGFSQFSDKLFRLFYLIFIEKVNKIRYIFEFYNVKNVYAGNDKQISVSYGHTQQYDILLLLITIDFLVSRFGTT